MICQNFVCLAIFPVYQRLYVICQILSASSISHRAVYTDYYFKPCVINVILDNNKYGTTDGNCNKPSRRKQR